MNKFIEQNIDEKELVIVSNIRLEPGWRRRVFKLMLRLRNVGRAEIYPNTIKHFIPTPLKATSHHRGVKTFDLLRKFK